MHTELKLNLLHNEDDGSTHDVHVHFHNVNQLAVVPHVMFHIIKGRGKSDTGCKVVWKFGLAGA